MGEKPKLRKTSKADSEQSTASQKDAPADDAAEALATSGVTEVKKKKKKVVKKKKKKEEPLEPPEFSSFLKTQILQEGEHIELKCRVECGLEGDPVDERTTLTWYFNDEVL